MQRFQMDNDTTLVQHERKAIRHANTWSGGERICYTQRVDIERNGRIIRSEEARFWHYPNGQLVRMEMVTLNAEVA